MRRVQHPHDYETSLRSLPPPVGAPTPPVTDVSSSGLAAAFKAHEADVVLELATLPSVATLEGMMTGDAQQRFGHLNHHCRYDLRHKWNHK